MPDILAPVSKLILTSDLLLSPSLAAPWGLCRPGRTEGQPDQRALWVCKWVLVRPGPCLREPKVPGSILTYNQGLQTTSRAPEFCVLSVCVTAPGDGPQDATF